jgi:non-specific serine/threonine protein kinase
VIVDNEGFRAQPTPLVGRIEDIAAADRLVRGGARLLTLVGPPGVGKTRLAQALFHKWSGSFPDGARFIDLSTITDACAVLPLITHAFRLPGHSRLMPFELLTRQIATGRVLIALDNFENVRGAARDIAHLLSHCGRLVIVVTSRMPLHLRWERVLDVGPLPIPALDPLPPLDELMRVPSVELFVSRARAADVRFAITEADAPTIAKLIVRLDGLPLAVELAAAQVRVLAPHDVLVRLERRLPLPPVWPVDVPPRHHTTNAAIAWSYDRLSPAEQTVFRQIGILRKPWTLAAAKAVVDPGLRAGAAYHLMELVANSLVRRVESRGSDRRFVVLETIREFALARLRDAHELDATERRHAHYFARMPKRSMAAILRLAGPWQRQALEFIDEQYDNFWAALQWARERQEPATALRLAQRLMPVWWRRGQFRQGLDELERLLVACRDAPARLRVDIMLSCALFAGWQGDLPRAFGLGRAGLRLARAERDEPSIARALARLGEVFVAQGRTRFAVPLLERALALWRTVGYPWGTAVTLRTLSTALAPTDPDRAYAAGKEALTGFQAIGDVRNVAMVLSQLAPLAHARGDPCEAERLLRTALMKGLECHDAQALLCALGWVVVLTASVAPPERVARVLASLKKFQDARHPLWNDARLRLAFEEAAATLRSRIPPKVLGAAWAPRLAVSLDDLMDDEFLMDDALLCAGALTAAAPKAATPTAASRKRRNELTSRQREVLALIAAGQASKKIAKTLAISDATVKYHVTSIFNKLGVDNRPCAVTLAAHQGLLATPDGWRVGDQGHAGPRPDLRPVADH